MDIQTIDQTYSQLQDQSRQSAQFLQTLGNKLATAAGAGDQQAREWMLDLRELALSIQAEQQQASQLLQQLHDVIAAGSAPPAAPVDTAPQPQSQESGGFLGNLMNSGFGRAVVTGAGFGIGDDLIKEIF